jgi:hypothetical protein
MENEATEKTNEKKKMVQLGIRCNTATAHEYQRLRAEECKNLKPGVSKDDIFMAKLLECYKIIKKIGENE